MMPAELRLTNEQYEALLGRLLADEAEHAAMLICGTGSDLLACRTIVPLGASDLLDEPDGRHISVSPIALARVVKRAATEGCSVVVCHSHPFPGTVSPSLIDLQTEEELCGRVLPGRLQGLSAGALIVGPDGVDGRLWRDGHSAPMSVTVGGRTVRSKYDLPGNADQTAGDRRFARQTELWGADGQADLANARMAVVGLGGTGSHVAIQLAHLGVGEVVLVDDDVVEVTNLNRLIGANADDIGLAKVDVAALQISTLRGGSARVTSLRRSILEMDLLELAGCDVVFSCTDTHGSRAVLSELAAQYLVPLIDLGIEVQPGSATSRAGGGVRVVRPGDPCLFCSGILNPALVRSDLLSDADRAKEIELGYLAGADVPAPSVVSLNGTIASLAVTEMLNLRLGLFDTEPRRLLYRAEARKVTAAETPRDPNCYVCGSEGLIGLGDARPLPRRAARPHIGAG